MRSLQNLFVACAAVILIAFSGVSRAGGLAEALDAYGRGDFVAAYKDFSVLAGAGNMDAAFSLAQMYEKGEGAPQNDSLAWSWYQRAAASGRTDAILRVAEFFEKGRGVPLSLRDAANWYARAADKGDLGALVRAGHIYATGIGVSPDVARAIGWLKRAQEEGDGEAEMALASLAARGLHVQSEPPGETAPKDERMAKVLKDARAIVESQVGPRFSGAVVKVGSDPRIMARDEGYLVFFPGMEVAGVGGGKLLLGTVRLLMFPEGSDAYRIEVTLPNRMRIVDTSGGLIAQISIGRQVAKINWSLPLASPTQADVTFEQMVVTVISGGGVSMTVGSVKSTLTSKILADGLIDMEETLGIENFVMKSMDTSDVLQFAKFGVGGTIKGLSANEGYRGLVASLGFGEAVESDAGDPQATKSNLKPDSRFIFADSFDANFTFSRIRRTMGGLAIGVGYGEIAAAIEGMRQPFGSVRIKIKIDDPIAPPNAVDGAMLPRAVALQATANRIPNLQLLKIMKTMLSDTLAPDTHSHGRGGASASSQVNVDTVLAALVAAGTELRIENTGLGAESYDVRVSGFLKPVLASDVFGSGDLQVDVRGLDIILESLLKGVSKDDKSPGMQPGVKEASATDIALAAAVEKAGKKGTDAQGRSIQSYRVILPPEGGVKINGKDLSELLGETAPSPGRIEKKDLPPLK